MAQQKLFRNSLCCCTGACSATICVSYCGTALSGLAVTIKDSTGATVFSGTANSSGCVSFSITGYVGPFTLSASRSGTNYSNTVPLSCGELYGWILSGITICALAFCGSYGAGANVTLTSGSTTVASGTTGSNGCVTLAAPSGTYTVTITSAFPTVNATQGMLCGSTYSFSACENSGLSGGFLTDANGTWPVCGPGCSSAGGNVSGTVCYTVAISNMCVPPITGAIGGKPVTAAVIYYSISCSGGTVTVTRTWFTCAYSIYSPCYSGVQAQPTSPAGIPCYIYCVDGCSWGNVCGTGECGQCSDTMTGTVNPLAGSYSTGGPGSLTCTGATLADPVGGGVSFTF